MSYPFIRARSLQLVGLYVRTRAPKVIGEGRNIPFRAKISGLHRRARRTDVEAMVEGGQILFEELVVTIRQRLSMPTAAWDIGPL